MDTIERYLAKINIRQVTKKSGITIALQECRIDRKKCEEPFGGSSVFHVTFSERIADDATEWFEAELELP